MPETTESKKPAVTLPGTVEKIIPANTIAPEKAQIAVEGADHLYREIRVDNTLHDEKGKKVGLKAGAQVAVKIEADKQNRDISDGEIRTACQQSCPTDAIVFGNINDRQSRVAQLKTQERTYGVLADINTRPRTTYVAGVLNINEDLARALGEYTS